MNTSRIYGVIAAIVAVAGLTACGGGGGGAGSDQRASRVESPFASANMFLPTGQASKSFAVSGCTRFVGAVTTAVTSATVVIQTNGDVVFSGAVGTGTVAELQRINFADANSRDVYGNSASDRIGSAVSYLTTDDRSLILESIGTSGEFNMRSTNVVYDCTTGPSTLSLTLEQPLSQARVVSNIVTGSTGTAELTPFGITVGNYTQTGSIVSWDSGRTGTFARFISFNLDTAQFGQGNSLAANTHTPVAFALPALGGTIVGFYEELAKPNGDKTIYFRHDNAYVNYTRYADPATQGTGRRFTFYDTRTL